MLDEPLASLDPLARFEFLEVLRASVIHDGISAVLSSHVVRDIEQGCDRLTVLGVGRVLFDGTLTSAVMQHGVIDGSSNGHAGAELVARLPSGADLVRIAGVRPAGLRQANLEEVVLGYLVRGRAAA